MAFRVAHSDERTPLPTGAATRLFLSVLAAQRLYTCSASARRVRHRTAATALHPVNGADVACLAPSATAGGGLALASQGLAVRKLPAGPPRRQLERAISDPERGGGSPYGGGTAEWVERGRPGNGQDEGTARESAGDTWYAAGTDGHCCGGGRGRERGPQGRRERRCDDATGEPDAKRFLFLEGDRRSGKPKQAACVQCRSTRRPLLGVGPLEAIEGWEGRGGRGEEKVGSPSRCSPSGRVSLGSLRSSSSHAPDPA